MKNINEKSKRTVYEEKLAKNLGFKSLYEYEKYCVKKKGFKSYSEYQEHLAKKNSFESLKEYQECLAKKHGFKNNYEYHKHLAEKNGFESRYDYQLFISLKNQKNPYLNKLSNLIIEQLSFLEKDRKWLGYKLNVSKATISRYISCKIFPKKSIQSKLFRILNLPYKSLEDLL